MKKSLIYFGLIILGSAAQAQGTFLKDVNGQPIFETAYASIEGTPYLNAEWTRGTVKAKQTGKTYELAKTRYNAYKDEFEYEENKKAYRFSSEITEFSSDGKTFKNGFPAVDGYTPTSFYQVIYEGKISLLKKHTVKLYSEKPYGSATEIKKFNKDEVLFLYKDHKLFRLKKDKKSILDALADKQAALEKFIKEQKLKLSNEEDLLRVIEFYEQ